MAILTTVFHFTSWVTNNISFQGGEEMAAIKKFIARVINRRGYTLLEMIVTLAIILIFMTSAALVLASGNSLYLKTMMDSNSTGIVETVADELKNYILYGEDIRMYCVLEADNMIVAGTDLSHLPVGTTVFPDGTYQPPEDSGIPGGTVTLLDVDSFIANGINVGYKDFRVEEDSSGREYVVGLPFSVDYYSDFDLTLRIEEELVPRSSDPDAIEDQVFTLEFTAENANTHTTTTSIVAVTGINK